MKSSRKSTIDHEWNPSSVMVWKTFGAALLFVIAAVVWAVLAVQPLNAQSVDPTAEPVQELVPGGTPVGVNDVNTVARQLWCPLCSGVRLDACELKACSQMKDEIGIMLSNGVEVQQIKDEFVTRYGPQVLGEPPRSGWSWLAWVLPFAVLLGGGVFLYMRARKMVPPAEAPAASAAPSSEYDRKLDDELNQYK